MADTLNAYPRIDKINLATELRESGKTPEAIAMYEEVIAQDKVQGNVDIDIMGHLRICYSHLADNTQNAENGKTFREKALDIAQNTVQELVKNPNKHKTGLLPIHLVHLAASQTAYSKFLETNESKQLLQGALTNIEKALGELPGSKAHQAWALNIMAKIYFLMGQYDNVYKALNLGFEALNQGKEEELSKDPRNGQMKLDIWYYGLILTKAEVDSKTKDRKAAQNTINESGLLDSTETYLEKRRMEAKILIESF